MSEPLDNNKSASSASGEHANNDRHSDCSYNEAYADGVKAENDRLFDLFRAMFIQRRDKQSSTAVGLVLVMDLVKGKKVGVDD